MVDPDRIEAMDDLMQDAIRFKYIAAPLTQAQLKELIQVPR
jgi:NitT/TauT family transport system substrate-binding protein